MTAPASGTMRIINGRQVKTETPLVKNMALRIMTKEARSTPDVLASMSPYLFHYHLLYLFSYFI